MAPGEGKKEEGGWGWGGEGEREEGREEGRKAGRKYCGRIHKIRTMIKHAA